VRGALNLRSGAVVVIGFLLAARGTAAQDVVVDAAPEHVVNTFSPPHALGGAIDRLRACTGAPRVEN
jgi:hypothetical protein